MTNQCLWLLNVAEVSHRIQYDSIHLVPNSHSFNYPSRVRTGYGILEKLWNFEKEIPYMEKLWNLSKTAVPMEKLWNFRFGGKKCVLSLRPDFEM